ncbi:MAG: Na/Pi symporter, partial [Planctomycetales bacterium]
YLPHGTQGEKSRSWIKDSIKWLPGHIKDFFTDVVGLSSVWLSLALLVCAILMILGALLFLTKTMRVLMANRIEKRLNSALEKSVYIGLIFGMVITIMVQSSSITTSLLVPMFGAGILTMEAGFPILVGANIGTTVTALLASLVTDDVKAAMTIAMVHLLFNCCGTAMFLPIRRMRLIPIQCAEWLADRAVGNKLWVVGYLLAVFVLMPLIGWLLWN